MIDNKDLRKTKQRRRLMDIFKTAQKPMTADQILKHCHIGCPNMALTTVYRNLDKLIDLGYINKTIYPDGAARYTTADGSHRHVVTCRICHAQAELPYCPVEMSTEWISNATGYKVEHHYLEYFGVCPSCLKTDLAFNRNKVDFPGVHQASDINLDEEEDYDDSKNKASDSINIEEDYDEAESIK